MPSSDDYFKRVVNGPAFQPGEEMKYELTRLGTYHDWPSWGRVRPVKLAPEGFFYTGERDVVSCFSCKAEIGQWELAQDPSERHRSLAPACPVVLGQSDNIPISPISTHSSAEEDDGFQDSHDASVEQGAESASKGLDDLYKLLREDKNPPRFLLNRVPEQITETNV